MARYNHLKYKLVNLLEGILLQSNIKIEPKLLYSININDPNRLIRDILRRNI